MAQSLSKLYVHIVFHIKNDNVVIRLEDEKELYAYIGGVIKANDAVPITIKGTENHLHVLTTMSKNLSLAKFVEEIKRNSSRWIKKKGIIINLLHGKADMPDIQSVSQKLKL